MNEYFKKIKIGFEYAQDKSLEVVGKSITKAFENSEIGKVIAAGFNAHISGQNPLIASFNQFIESFSDVINSAIDRMDTILDYSQMTDAQVRDLKLSYGFSSSEAYGYSTAMDIMGFSSMEDLMYANEQQLSQFRASFEKYSNYYTELYDSGYFEKLQEYQVEMKEFRLDMEHEVIDFFMEHKDTIMATMEIVMTVSDFIMDALGWIVDFLGGDSGRSDTERARETQSILNSYVNASKSTNVNIANQFTNIQPEDTTWLANSGQLTFRQIIKALS